MTKQQKKARTDLKGVVLITIQLTNADGERVRGNRVRTFKVGEATVTAVADSLERIFERPDVYRLRP